MYQAENTNFKTNQSVTQEFTRSCLGRILIAGVIILVGLLLAYFTAPKESDMNEEMLDNVMQCIEVNDAIKGDAVDDYVHNLTFIFTTADTTQHAPRGHTRWCWYLWHHHPNSALPGYSVRGWSCA